MYEEEDVRPAGKKEWRSFGRLLKKARIPWLLVAAAFVLSVISARLSVLFPDYSIQFFEEGNITQRTILTGIGLLVLAAVFSIAKSYLEAWLRTDISMRLRDKVMEKIFALRLCDLHDRNPRELISRTANDTSLLSDFIVTIFMVLAGEVFHFFFALYQIYTYHSILFLVQLLFIPISILSRWIQGSFAYRFQYRIQARLSSLTEYLSERLINIPLIKIFARETDETTNGEEKIDEYARVRTHSAVLDTVFSIVDEMLRLGNRIFAIFYGGYLVYRGSLGIGTWIAYYMLVEQASLNLDIIAAQWPVLKGVQGSIARTAEIVDAPEESYTGEALPDATGDLIFRDFDLSLGEKKILSDLSTKLSANDTVAIAGCSGSGKSTLLSALVRFYDPQKGRLTLEDTDVRSYDLHMYRDRFAYCMQDIHLFSGTLRDNLCYGIDREVSEEEILACCKDAGLLPFLDKCSDGLDTYVAEDGGHLSGGERQRIGIARALLKDADILLLDESTSSLDIQTEHEVVRTIRDHCANKLLILVTHHMDLVRDADHILFLEDGRLLAEGSHAELLLRCPSYQALCAAHETGVG